MSGPNSRADESRAAPDPEAWIDEHGDVLYRYALARVRDRAVAEDLVQETLLAAIRGLDGYARASTERTWLIGILRHKLLDHFRHSMREEQIRDETAPADGRDDDFDEQGRWRVAPVEWSAPESSLDREQFWRVFESCLEDLPEKLRTPFLLRELDGLDTRSLTDLLSVTQSNLWAMLSRARRRLRGCLSRRWFEA